MTFFVVHFSKLTAKQLYAILKLRQEVFVVEQQCWYLDCDDKDQQAFHVLGMKAESLVAYARILPPALAYEEPSIGRVIVARTERNTGLGKVLMRYCIEQVYSRYGRQTIRIAAQCQHETFYRQLGFQSVEEKYDMDGIPHQDMNLHV
jgi:ElaA protein